MVSLPVCPLSVSRSLPDLISPWTPYEQHPEPIKYLEAYPFLYLPCLTACLLVWFAFPALKALPYWSQSIGYLVPNGSSSFTLSLCMRTCMSLWKCPVIRMNPLAEMSTKELYIFKCGHSHPWLDFIDITRWLMHLNTELCLKITVGFGHRFGGLLLRQDLVWTFFPSLHHHLCHYLSC